MKKSNRTTKRPYVRPSFDVFQVEVEGRFLQASPRVRPGGGGSAGSQGSVQVIDPTEVDGGDDDNLEG
ncbi:hypothetical protein [Alloprevotella tannerae]|uniref:hypothetical protein n=1 Tax=Alloprevotella tannerae TaxID=76122 RepID=UPI0028E3669E|nr:hypothetical protein [Alloprevotella tannerae]